MAERFLDGSHNATVLFQLYTLEATRGAEIRLREDGAYYYVPLERVGAEEFRIVPGRIALYASEAEAENAAVNSPWFLHGERPQR